MIIPQYFYRFKFCKLLKQFESNEVFRGLRVFYTSTLNAAESDSWFVLMTN